MGKELLWALLPPLPPYSAVAVIATVALSVMADLGSLLHCSYTAQSLCQGVPQADKGPLLPSQCHGASKGTYPGCQSASPCDVGDIHVMSLQADTYIFPVKMSMPNQMMMVHTFNPSAWDTRQRQVDLLSSRPV